MVGEPAGFSLTRSHNLTTWAGGFIIGNLEVREIAEYFV